MVINENKGFYYQDCYFRITGKSEISPYHYNCQTTVKVMGSDMLIHQEVKTLTFNSVDIQYYQSKLEQDHQRILSAYGYGQ